MVSVKYSGPLLEGSGYAQANRNIVASLHRCGVDVVTEIQRYADHPTDYGEKGVLAKTLQNKHQKYPIKVLHITPNVYQKHKEQFKYNIGHLFWETTKMSPKWAWYLNEVREIWTGCEENVKTFKESGFEGKIVKLPQPVDTEHHEPPMKIENARGFIFGAIFQWIERKDPKSLLTAYWQEFQDNKDVTLVIKTYGLGYEQHEANRIYDQISKWKAELGQPSYPQTLIIDYLLSDYDIHRLYESVDCLVAPHRFEGWGEITCEALAHKKPLITTPLGGVHEWLSKDCYYPIKYTMCDVFGMDWAEQYTVEGNQWAQVDVGDLRKQMRYVYENQDEAKNRGEKGYKEVCEKLSFKIVGEAMKGRIQEIYQEQGFNV